MAMLTEVFKEDSDDSDDSDDSNDSDDEDSEVCIATFHVLGSDDMLAHNQLVFIDRQKTSMIVMFNDIKLHLQHPSETVMYHMFKKQQVSAQFCSVVDLHNQC